MRVWSVQVSGWGYVRVVGVMGIVGREKIGLELWVGRVCSGVWGEVLG